ncbi:ABC transporter ATP-binding protein [Streptomyces sp. NPDC057027]|uniref:ABC transporter ATP-binding protein n=1 Tax=Streptomyces sp. NPDC057027 TaxID=3346004 RepID=UPI0036438D7B
MARSTLTTAAPPETPSAAAPPVAVRTVGLSRSYGDKTVLHPLDLEIPGGGLVGLLGPNGAGKSTLLSLLVGLRRPSSGHCELFGGDPRKPVHRRLIGVTPQETGLPLTLRVGEVVDFAAAHYENPVPRGELLDRFGLLDKERRQTGGLSGGEKRRLAVALAFVGRPRMVFLDEPTTGLDVETRHTLWDVIRAFHAEGGTVLLTSHYLEEIESLADRVVVLTRGRVVADDTVDALRGLVRAQRVSLLADDVPPLPGILSSERVDGRIHLLTPDADALVRDLVTSRVPFSGLEVRSATLEEAFLTLADEAGADDAPAGTPAATTQLGNSPWR